MCCLRCESLPPKICVSRFMARRSVAGSDLLTGTMAVFSLPDRGRESKTLRIRCHEAAELGADAIVTVFARRSTMMLVEPAADGGKRNVATSPAVSWEDCRLVPHVFANLFSKSRAVRVLSCQVCV